MIDYKSNVTETAAEVQKAVNGKLLRFGSKKDVAAMIGLGVRTVDNLMAEGMPHLKLGARRCRFDLPEVAAWLKERFGQQRQKPASIKPATKEA